MWVREKEEFWVKVQTWEQGSGKNGFNQVLPSTIQDKPRRHTNLPKTTTPPPPPYLRHPADAARRRKRRRAREEPLPTVARCRLLSLPAHVAFRPAPGEDPAALTAADRASHCLSRTRTREEKLLPPVDGTFSRPTGNDQDVEVSAWLRLDQMVLAWIASSFSDDVLLQVVHCTYARKICQTLEVLYETVSGSRVQGVKRELHSLTKGAMSVTAYIHHARALSRTLSLANDPICDIDLIFLLLAGLPVEFDSVVATIQLATPLPSLDSMAATLTDFEQRLKNYQSTSLSSIALVAAADQRSSHGVSLSGRGSGRGSFFSNR
ncbi:hypothetical protein Droror1_Dr00022290 [Drosera rotundifolia]